MMHLVEIDPVRFQTFETRLDRGHDVAARRAFHGTRIVHRRAELGRKDDVLAPVAEKLPEAGLRAAALAIDVSGVEESDSKVERFGNNFARSFGVDAVTK